MKANDVFISYSRRDLAWVEEELLPALKGIGARLFLDDAELRKHRESLDAKGLAPSAEMEPALRAALGSSRFVLLIQSPDYFSSKWCRWEIDVADKLAEEEKALADGLHLVRIVLSKSNDRLDPTPTGERYLFVDLCDVTTRVEKLAFALGAINPTASPPPLTLGRRSLKDHLSEAGVKTQVEALKAGFQKFREAHAKMQAFKEVHDAMQQAQDTWNSLAEVRARLREGVGEASGATATDLVDKCNEILAKLDDPALEGERFPWRNLLERGLNDLADLSGNMRQLEGLDRALERTRVVLISSTVPAQLNEGIRRASEKMPVGALSQLLVPLRKIAALPWQPALLDELTKLTFAFDELDKKLAEITTQVLLHDGLQNIDSIFSVALGVEMRLFDIENVWPDIESERQRIDGGKYAAQPKWLPGLSKAASTVTEYLHRLPKPEVPPMDEVELFRDRLNFSFHSADIELKHNSHRLDRRQQEIAEMLERLAKSP